MRTIVAMVLLALVAGGIGASGCAADDGGKPNFESSDADADTDGDADTDTDADSDSDSDPGCDEGTVLCQDDLTVVTCIDGSWEVTDECNEGTQLCEEGECVDCVDIAFEIQTMQACAMSIVDGFEMDGEGFIELYGDEYRVFAMDRWGEGHVIGWCDGTTLGDLLDAFNVIGYLGQVEDPAEATVAAFGDNFLCNPGAYSLLPDYINYLGEDLPAEYLDDPAALAEDYDVVIFCGFRIPWTNDWVEEIGTFVSVHGKGFLAVMEYEGVTIDLDFENMSDITQPAGIVFDPLNLEWAPASAEVLIECVPDMPPDIE